MPEASRQRADESTIRFDSIRCAPRRQLNTSSEKSLRQRRHIRLIDLMTIVTANTAEFKRIRGLNVENWLV